MDWAQGSGAIRDAPGRNPVLSGKTKRASRERQRSSGPELEFERNHPLRALNPGVSLDSFLILLEISATLGPAILPYYFPKV